MSKTAKRLMAAILVWCMLLPAAFAMAAEEDKEDKEAPKGPQISNSQDSIIDTAVLQPMVEKILADEGVDQKDVGIGFYYSGTGDSWYYNGDSWFYPASMYKVPLMMLLAEKVSSGELSQDSPIYDSTVAEVEEHILTYSNNHWAHLIRKYLGGDEKWREDAKKYAQLKDSDYDPDYLEYCYFSPRYMTQVMTTLYKEPQRFPNLYECLDAAMPGEYFERSLSQYTVAQKYGSFLDQRGVNFNSCAGIIGTPNPIVVVVMTRNVTNYQGLIARVGQELANYSLQLDQGLEAHAQALAEAEAKREQERLAAEAEAQRLQQEQERLAAEAEAKRLQAIEDAAEKEKRDKFLSIALKVLAAVAAVAAVVVVVVIVVKLRSGGRRKSQARSRRRYYDDQDDEDFDGYDEAYPRRRSSRRYEPEDDYDYGYDSGYSDGYDDYDDYDDSRRRPAPRAARPKKTEIYRPARRRDDYDPYYDSDYEHEQDYGFDQDFDDSDNYDDTPAWSGGEAYGDEPEPDFDTEDLDQFRYEPEAGRSEQRWEELGRGRERRAYDEDLRLDDEEDLGGFLEPDELPMPLRRSTRSQSRRSSQRRGERGDGYTPKH